MGSRVVEWDAQPEPVGESHWRFPRPAALPEGDLVTIGGDLEPATLIAAYRHGIFPMQVAELPGRIAWWSPDPRGVIPLDGLRVTQSMRRSAKRYEIRVNTAFDQVIRACADPTRPKGWITPEFIAAYRRLHELGWAHSVETFDREGRLAGGLYGVRIAGFFAGESMFHHERDASKVALMTLVDLMRASGMRLLDVQWSTEHLESLGAIAIPRREYLTILAEALPRQN
jgi:leucyl/phenylalanyl-tRNA--protein transferase